MLGVRQFNVHFNLNKIILFRSGHIVSHSFCFIYFFRFKWMKQEIELFGPKIYMENMNHLLLVSQQCRRWTTRAICLHIDTCQMSSALVELEFPSVSFFFMFLLCAVYFNDKNYKKKTNFCQHEWCVCNVCAFIFAISKCAKQFHLLQLIASIFVWCLEFLRSKWKTNENKYGWERPREYITPSENKMRFYFKRLDMCECECEWVYESEDWCFSKSWGSQL